MRIANLSCVLALSVCGLTSCAKTQGHAPRSGEALRNRPMHTEGESDEIKSLQSLLLGQAVEEILESEIFFYGDLTESERLDAKLNLRHGVFRLREWYQSGGREWVNELHEKHSVDFGSEQKREQEE